MNKKDQVTIVKDLCAGLTSEIIALIVNGKIPPDWDGLELRQLVSDHAAQQSRLHGDRRVEYENTVVIENL